jgi:hypothetical protein
MESFISITQNENNIRPFYIHYLISYETAIF